MKDLKKDLRDLKGVFSGKKEEQIRAQTRLDGAKQRRQESVNKIKAEGHEVKTLPAEITSLETKFQAVLDEIRTQLEGEGEAEFEFE